MKEKLSFLKKYIHSKEKDIRIISSEQISKIDSTLIPKSWVEIFGEEENISCFFGTFFSNNVCFGV